MMNSKTLFHELVGKITIQEDSDEIKGIVFLVMETLFGLTRTDIMAGKNIQVQPDHFSKLEQTVRRINNNEPIQYIIGEATFYGRTFRVNPSVLIPRPETELLVRTVLSWRDDSGRTRLKDVPRILDIGTGSGCIPITLQLEWPRAEVFATDISLPALAVAAKNAALYKADITFLKHDILGETIPVAALDVIVSNPPYVRRSESSAMRENVLEYEPHSALFVPDDDPLVFYREILLKSKVVLGPDGLVAVEVNENFGAEVAELFVFNGFTDVSILKDIEGKQRVVRGMYQSQH